MVCRLETERCRPDLRVAPCSRPSRPHCAACGGGLRPALTAFCARRDAVRQVGTEKRPRSRTEKHRLSGWDKKGAFFMMRWPGGNEGQTESVVAGGRTPLQGVCLRHRG